jgi:hypothetical protein
MFFLFSPFFLETTSSDCLLARKSSSHRSLLGIVFVLFLIVVCYHQNEIYVDAGQSGFYLSSNVHVLVSSPFK